ncbi:hypothetical protein PSHT_01846, partial [Puccinia striiformis]
AQYPSVHHTGKIFSPATDYTPYTGALGGINPSCAPRGLDKKGDSKSLIFNRQIIKKLVQVGYPLAEDYFDGEEWEENLEQTQNKPTCPSINMESLQEALMDINEKIQLENND